jgi:hypothetical protein
VNTYFEFGGNGQAVNITDGAAHQSAVFGSNTVLFQNDADCFFLTGLNPTATTTTGHFMPAGSAWTVKVDQGHKASIIPASGDNVNFYISPIKGQ